MLTFNRELHQYRLAGEIITGITGMLRLTGRLGDVERVPQEFRDAGSARHHWIEAYLRGRITPRTRIPDCVAPYLAGVRLALAETGAGILAVEELVCNRAGPYATQVDARVRWRGDVFAWNWKTGNAWAFYPVQLALEALCYARPPRRACVYLNKRGKYRVEEHTDPRDFREALSVISEYRATLRHAGTPTEGSSTHA